MRSTPSPSGDSAAVAFSEPMSARATSPRWLRSSLTVTASESASSSSVGSRWWIARNERAAATAWRSKRRTERGAQSCRRSSSSTAPWMRVHRNCSSVAPRAGS